MHDCIVVFPEYALASYNKLGVKIDDVSDVVGASWLLNAGGVINRTVYDLPDEKQTRNLISDISILNIPTTQEGTPQGNSLSNLVKDINLDKEVDIFNYSVDSYSGSFYLDSNFQPVLLEEGTGVKIETVGSFSTNYQFILTTDTGIKYYFGGENFTEETFIRNNSYLNAKSSFYLSKIESDNNLISFSYYTDQPKQVSQKIDESKSISYFSDFPNTPGCIAPPQYQHQFENQTLTVKNTKRINKITYDNEELHFIYGAFNGMNYGKLNQIKVYHHLNLQKQIDFDYLYNTNLSSPERFFLEDIKTHAVRNNINTLINEYIFSYDDPLSLPGRYSKSKDVLGYYNGASNYTLLPDLSLLGATSFNLPNLADRRCFFEYSKKGTLKSVKYPTKGKTVFEYETIPVRTENPQSVSLIIGNNDFITNQLGMPVTYESSQSHQFNPIIGSTISLDLHLSSEIQTAAVNKGNAKFELIDQSNNQVVYSKWINIGKEVTQTNFHTEISIDNSKTYILKFKKDIFCNECNGAAIIEYKKGYKAAEGIGLRLKKQFDVNETGDTINIRRIYYSKIEDINKPELLPTNLYTPGRFISSYYAQIFTNHQPQGSPAENELPGCLPKTYFAAQNILHSEPVIPFDVDLSSLSGLGENPIISISYGGDNFENGGEQKEFINNDGSNSNTLKEPIFDPPYFVAGPGYTSDILLSKYLSKTIKKVNYNKYNGLQTKKFIYSKLSNGNLGLKSKVENIYQRSESILNHNLLSTPVYNIVYSPPGVTTGNELHNIYVGTYANSTYFNFLEKTVTTEYLEDVPYNVLDDTSYKKLKNEIKYEYNSPVKISSKIKQKFSDNSLTETTYAYAHEKGNQYLISKNMIGIPLETTVIKKADSTAIGKLISKSAVLFPTLQTEADQKTSGLALPYETQSAFANATLATDVIYDKYDDKGNIVQYTSKDGIPTTIVWGYSKTQPIAKIVGAAYSDVSSLVSAIVDASDTDASTPSTEPVLITALDSFRKNSSLAGYQVTTYTYDPLIGVTSITPPSGIREVYLYDSANRLKEIRENNAAGKLIKEFRYNYKQ